MIRYSLAFTLILSIADAQSRPEQNPLESFKEFSATATGGMMGLQSNKVYRSGNLMRLDLEDQYRITDLKTLTTWVVYPKRCSHVDMPDAGAYPFTAFRNFKVERKPVGKEDVDGHTCTVEDVTFTAPDKPLVAKIKMWEAEELNGFPIVMEVTTPVGGKFKLTYTKVNLKAPDPGLFKRPARCREFSTGTVKGSKKPGAKPSEPPQETPKP
jgi:hypothetical protein